MLRGLVERGAVSVHYRDPGTAGMGMLGPRQAFRPGTFRVSGNTARNVREITLPIEASGRAQFVGIWDEDGRFTKASPIRPPVDVSPGSTVRFAPGRLTMRID